MAQGAVAAMPAWTPGSYLVRDYARFVDRVRVLDGRKERPLGKLDKQRWQLPPSKRDLLIRYRVYGNDLTVRTNHMDATHAQIIPAATFLYLEGQLDRPVEVRFEGFPPAWEVASALPLKKGAYFARDFDALVDAPFELGTFRSRSFHSGGTTFLLAITGMHNGDEGRITEATQKIVEAAGAIFGGFPFKRYVFLLTFAPKLRGGLEHRDCTSLISDSLAFDRPEGYFSLFQLVAHEFFHAWNVKRLHDLVLGPFDYSRENPTSLLWFHEGLTAYMEHVLVLRAGVVPWSHTAKELARCWTEQVQRPGRLEQNLEESSWDAWIRLYKPNEFSPNSSVSYYDKGEMVAWLMDASIREGSQGKAGLAELFALLWKRHGEKGLTDADLRRAYHELSGKSPEPFWNAVHLGSCRAGRDPTAAGFWAEVGGPGALGAALARGAGRPCGPAPGPVLDRPRAGGQRTHGAERAPRQPSLGGRSEFRHGGPGGGWLAYDDRRRGSARPCAGGSRRPCHRPCRRSGAGLRGQPARGGQPRAQPSAAAGRQGQCGSEGRLRGLLRPPMAFPAREAGWAPVKIAAIIAAHDEAESIALVLGGLKPFGLHRILVVDDGSTDGTGAAAASAGAEVLRLEFGQGGGKGQAMRAGMARLRADDFDFYLFLDADGQHDPADLQRFLDHLAAHPDADFLIGSRFQDRAKIPAKRWRTNALGTWTLGRIAGVTWEDSQSGFRMIRKKVLDRLDLRATGFAIEMEIAMKAADWKLRWAHIPIQAIYRPGPHRSHFRGVMDTWLIAWESLKC